MRPDTLIIEPYSPIFSLRLDNQYKCLERTFSKIRDLEGDLRNMTKHEQPDIDSKEEALRVERSKLRSLQHNVDAIKGQSKDRILLLRRQRRSIYFKRTTNVKLPWDVIEYILELSASEMSWATLPLLQRLSLPISPIVAILGNIKDLFGKVLKETLDSCVHGINRLWNKRMRATSGGSHVESLCEFYFLLLITEW